MSQATSSSEYLFTRPWKPRHSQQGHRVGPTSLLNDRRNNAKKYGLNLKQCKLGQAPHFANVNILKPQELGLRNVVLF